MANTDNPKDSEFHKLGNSDMSRDTKHLAKYQFAKGTSGNPAGRKKGARDRLQTGFLEDLAADWEKHGLEAIRMMRVERPADYVRCIAGLMPKSVSLSTEQAISEMTDEQLAETLMAVRNNLATEAVN
jgi:hypothetical protein